jgi:hypothetical protein
MHAGLKVLMTMQLVKLQAGIILHDFSLYTFVIMWLEYLQHFSNWRIIFALMWFGTQYVIIFSLTWFGIHDLWPLLSCVGGYQTVTSLLHHQSHVWIHYNGDINKRMSQFTLQHRQLMLLKYVRNVNPHHLVQSKWKICEGQSVLMRN